MHSESTTTLFMVLRATYYSQVHNAITFYYKTPLSTFKGI